MTNDLSTPALKIYAFLDRLSAADLDAWGELWDNDGVMISMFDFVDGEPSRHEGRDAVVAYFEAALPLFEPFTFDDIIVHATTGNIGIAEWRSTTTVVATGEPYENRFIGVFDFGLSGLVEEYRQYRDPNAFTRATGG